MRTAFIVVWLALQIGLPLRYYLGADRFDERFAWRMFSPVRMVACQTRFIDETGGEQRLVRPAGELHEVWTGLIARARRSIIDGYARRWCNARRAEGLSRPILKADVTCVDPATQSRPICLGAPTDADGDGVPDTFRTAPGCSGLDPKACFVAECGTRTAARCREETCTVRPIPEDLNLCETDEARP